MSGEGAPPAAATRELPPGRELGTRLTPFWQGVVAAVAGAGLLLAIDAVFRPAPLTRFRLRDDAYLYVLVGVFVSLVFLLFPAHPASVPARPLGRRRLRPRPAPRRGVPWYDVALFLVALGIPLYFASIARQLNAEGWALGRPPTHAVVLGIVMWATLLEAARRTSGLLFAGIVFVASLYPTYAGAMPPPLHGFDIPFADTVRFHLFSQQSVVGEPIRVLGSLLIGFLVFGAVLQHTGGGQFFADLAAALLGRVRGGTAKVAIVASGAFGMLSSSGVSNVLSTGTVTIPAMKRSGFPAAFAAGVEANAANGGTLVPPVMGATAFLMSTVLDVPYATVVMAAVLPALLFYYSLFIQLDAYAARYGIRGVPASETPPLWPTLRRGWPYIVTLVLLIGAILQLRAEADAALVAAGLLLVLTAVARRTLGDWRRALDAVLGIARLLAELTSQLAAVGMLVGSLYLTGTVGSITSDIIHLVGDNPWLLLGLAALLSFGLGTGLPDTAAYVFLAVMLAPALVRAGFDPLAVHFFILYWSNIADVTPPVAIAVVAASGVAQSPVMATMVEATRLAAVKYVLPFFFVLNPVLMLQQPDLGALAAALGLALAGITVAAYALQGYLPRVGVLAPHPAAQAARALLVGGAALFAVPHPAAVAGGAAVVAGAYAGLLAARRLGLPLAGAAQQLGETKAEP